MLLVKGKHVAIQGALLRIKVFRAVAAHILSGFAVVGKNPFCDTGQTGDGGQVEEKHGVAVLQPVGDGAVEIAIDDPPGLLQLGL